MVRRADLVERGPLAVPRASFQAEVARTDGFERRIADRVLERLDVAVADALLQLRAVFIPPKFAKASCHCQNRFATRTNPNRRYAAM
jgi:hypothetical protein